MDEKVAANIKTLIVSFALVLIVLIVTVGVYNSRKNELIVQAIKHGASPMEASCAINDVNYSTVCTQLAQNRTSKSDK